MADKVKKPEMAIVAEVESNDTGAISNYHVPSLVSFDLQNDIVTVSFVSYVSERAYRNGKMPVGYPSVKLQGIDDGANQAISAWLDKVAEATDHVLSGGQVIKAE